MKYRVFTKWIGYSEIEVEATSEKKAREIVDERRYDPNDEKCTLEAVKELKKRINQESILIKEEMRYLTGLYKRYRGVVKRLQDIEGDRVKLDHFEVKSFIETIKSFPVKID